MNKNVIDITPTWEGILPVLLMVLRNPKASSQSIETAKQELTRMAQLADLYVAQAKETE
jgi:hypothetical protein